MHIHEWMSAALPPRRIAPLLSGGPDYSIGTWVVVARSPNSNVGPSFPHRKNTPGTLRSALNDASPISYGGCEMHFRISGVPNPMNGPLAVADRMGILRAGLLSINRLID